MGAVVASYVLGGGRSRRFGADKALVRLRDGRTMAQRAAAALPSAATLVVASVTPAHEALGLRVITDRVAGLGPAGGLDAALEDAGSRGIDLVAVVACDMPWVEARLIALQLEALTSSGSAACMPRLAGFWEPMHAVYRASLCRQALAEQLRGGERRMQAIVAALEPLEAQAATGIDDAGRWQRSTRSANRPELLGDLLAPDD